MSFQTEGAGCWESNASWAPVFWSEHHAGNLWPAHTDGRNCFFLKGLSVPTTSDPGKRETAGKGVSTGQGALAWKSARGNCPSLGLMAGVLCAYAFRKKPVQNAVLKGSRHLLFLPSQYSFSPFLVIAPSLSFRQMHSPHILWVLDRAGAIPGPHGCECDTDLANGRTVHPGPWWLVHN